MDPTNQTSRQRNLEHSYHFVTGLEYLLFPTGIIWKNLIERIVYSNNLKIL